MVTIFQCPTNTVSNIIRQEYDTVVRPKVDEYNQAGQKKDESNDPKPYTEPAPESIGNDTSSPIPDGAEEVSPAEKITPAKQMEMMRKLKENKNPRAAKSSSEKEVKEDKADTPPEITHPHTTQKETKNKAVEAPGAFRPQVRMPSLDDIVFAPVKHGKIIEIDDIEENPAESEEVKVSAEKKDEKKADDGNGVVVNDSGLSRPITIGQGKGEEIKEDRNDNPPIEDAKTAKYGLNKGLQEVVGVDDKATPTDSEAEPAAAAVDFRELIKDVPRETPESSQTIPTALEPTVPEVTAESLANTAEELNSANKPESQPADSPDAAPKRVFQPKAQRLAPKGSVNDMNPKAEADTPAATVAPKEKKGFLSSLFGGGEKKKEEIENAPNPNPEESTPPASPEVDTGKIAGTSKEVIPNEAAAVLEAAHTVFSKEEVIPSVSGIQTALPQKEQTEPYHHDGGKIFIHIHSVTLKKQFGVSSVGPYRFIFWPLRIIEMQSKRTWADFLVHVTDQNGNEILLCTDGAYKELIVKVDGKEFNVYATWTNGLFESHVSPYGKTASIFTIEDEVYKEERKNRSVTAF